MGFFKKYLRSYFGQDEEGLSQEASFSPVIPISCWGWGQFGRWELGAEHAGRRQVCVRS